VLFVMQKHRSHDDFQCSLMFFRDEDRLILYA
jgi:hypothetical protein